MGISTEQQIQEQSRRIGQRVWRLVPLFAILAGLGVTDAVFQFYTYGNLKLGTVLMATVVAVCGRQMIGAQEMFLRVAPEHARGWLRPAGFALYAVAAVTAALAVAHSLRGLGTH